MAFSGALTQLRANTPLASRTEGRRTLDVRCQGRPKQITTIRERPRARGFVPEDNSGKANIFAVEPRQLYTSSPTSEKAARQGLGGAQGLLLVGVVAAVALGVTLGIAKTDKPQTLEQAQAVAAAPSRSSLSSLSKKFQ